MFQNACFVAISRKTEDNNYRCEKRTTAVGCDVVHEFCAKKTR